MSAHTMSGIHMALLSFWNSFTWNGHSVPAFPAGRVPKQQPYPYITYDTQLGAFGSISNPVTYVWCKMPMDNSYNAQTQRAQIMDAVAEAIPEGGKLLSFPGGAVWLKRNDANFMTYYDPKEEDNIESPTGEPVIGGRISLFAQYFAR